MMTCTYIILKALLLIVEAKEVLVDRGNRYWLRTRRIDSIATSVLPYMYPLNMICSELHHKLTAPVGAMVKR
jgi:hypothetical protein